MTGNVENAIPRKILLADDSVTIQKVVKITLGQTSHKLFEVSSHDELFKFLTRTPVDLVLLDFTLSSQVDGYTLVTQLKNQFPEVKVIILYGTFDVVNEEKLRIHFVDDFIIKPFESTRFLEKCQLHLNHDPVFYEKKSQELPKELESKEEVSIENLAVEEQDFSNWEMHEYRPNKQAIIEETKEDKTQELEIPMSAQDDEKTLIIHEVATNPNLNLEIEDWGVAIPTLPIKEEKDEKEEKVKKEEIPSEPAHIEIESPENLWDKDPVLGLNTEEIKNPESISVIDSQTQQDIKQMIESQCLKIIEKVAWEVIPELAENLIAKELEKIRIATQAEIQNKLFSANHSLTNTLKAS